MQSIEPYSSLYAITPADGRYAHQLNDLRLTVSEYGLIHYRYRIEFFWLQALCQYLPKYLDGFHKHQNLIEKLSQIASSFNEQDAQGIKAIEKTINHDVKAVEYWIKKQLQTQPDLSHLAEWVHFACTSEDINNLAYALMAKDTKKQHLLPHMDQLISQLQKLAHLYADQPMLARTHGQPASPTTVGKELANVCHRLKQQRDLFDHVTLLAKMNGATGNYNAHCIALPQANWPHITQQFIHSLGLTANPYTTQIEPHDTYAEYLGALCRFNTVLLDFNRDIWSYIAIGYFKQKIGQQEVGSSTMPHKINPIDFENSEGNIGIANALAYHLIQKLPLSRWQRDLSDSTTLRHFGCIAAHSLLAYQATLKGLAKLDINAQALSDDLNQHWEVLAEAIQTMMRRYQLPNPYEQLKTLTRANTVTRNSLHTFIDGLDGLPDEAKLQLKQLTPATYTGQASQLARLFNQGKLFPDQ